MVFTKHNRALNQDGIVSFITVMLLSMILVLITVGFVRSTNSNQRQSLDTQLATQAFYSAESGVNDALATIAHYKSIGSEMPSMGSNNCNAFMGQEMTNALGGQSNVLNGSSNIKYTCVLVKDEVSNISLSDPTINSGKIFKIKSASVAAPVKSLRISWGNDGQVASNTNYSNLPVSWSSNPALLRVTIYYPPNLTNYNRSTLLSNQKTYFLIPVPAGTAGATNTVSSTNDGEKLGISCNFPTPKTCQVKIMVNSIAGGGASTDNGFYVRIVPIYVSSNISIEGLDVSNNVVSLSGAQYQIDVTGRGNDVYKRIEVRRNFGDVYDFPDSVVASGGDLCKQFIAWPGTAAINEAGAACNPF